MKAVVVQSDGTYETQDLSEDLAALQDAVNGYVEVVYSPFRPGLVALVNEDGLMRQMEHNAIASAIMLKGLVGPVVFVGPSEDEDSDFGDCPEWVVKWIAAANESLS